MTGVWVSLTQAFYEKMTKNGFVMMENTSAKRKTLVKVVKETIGEILSKISKKMRDSGYGSKMRRKVIDLRGTIEGGERRRKAIIQEEAWGS